MSTTAVNDRAVAPNSESAESLGESTFRQVYRELREPHVEADVLVQLRSNLAQLEDLHGRMKFMMSELSYLLKRG